MYETQLYLSYTQQRVLHVLEHCKFLFSELEKKIANEQEERITLEKIQFQCPTQLSLPHGRITRSYYTQLSVPLFLCVTGTTGKPVYAHGASTFF